ncbi:type II toxin-antitoxin system death-on-curing family toxin [Merismopedia glauca]|uniref:Type II toxin-antitoxin system death-on-curing family toxin n=1 Tax=Merismopedia glauca CCAP 1448/3 TaxID=1296344 RepID=A0A2T1BX09_9CYAN|nr:type II toxin-antitoxin system death-on-curing family toxin [Merismopedia glauca]PSB00531.1 type II toxin-antitoxin system death-on-curing family toxin [Merismopedia glauca CCAP 1448/3]
MADIIWIDRLMTISIHDDQIAAHGGAYGILNQAMLESALARPRNLYVYEEVDLFQLAAAYAYGLAKNHGFVDGNKRTAFLVTFAFLKVNGWHLYVAEPEVVLTMQNLAAGVISETELAQWLRSHSQPNS